MDTSELDDDAAATLHHRALTSADQVQQAAAALELEDGPRAASRPLLRTTLLAVFLVIAGTVVMRVLHLSALHHGGNRLDWWAVALLAVGAELMVFHIEFRREVYTFTFSEVPLVLGLFFASPMHLIVGRLIGTAVFLVVKERQPIRKLTLNLASYYGECVVLLTVDHLLPHGDAHHPSTWGTTILAVFAADLLGFVVVAKAVRWHGGPIRLRSILAIGVVTAPLNTAIALTAVLLLGEHPWTVLLLAGVAVAVLLAYRSYSRLRQRFDSLSLLYEFTRLVSGAQRPDTVLHAILTQAKNLLRAERAEIWVADDDGNHLRLVVDDNGLTTSPAPGDLSGLVRNWFGDALDTTVITADEHDPRLQEMAAALGATDCIVAPITEAGVVVGLVAVVDRLGELEGFRPQEGPMFATLANHASVALENGRLIVRLHEQARQREHESLHDALTGLPNRVLFHQRLSDLLDAIDGDTTSVGVALMDLDGFKEINDTLGHHCGDQTLIEVARRIERVIRPNMTVARLGGDEFALLIPGVHRRAELEAIGRRIRRTLAEPMHIEGVRISAGISIGFALAPSDGRDAATLLQRADVAMYGAKTGLGDGVNFYDADSDANTPRRFALTNDLHSAIRSGEMSLVYQPKVRLQDGAVVGFEALARWTHPRFGSISPDEFVPLAERSGVIVQITEFVLATALRQAADWQRQARHWNLSVNVSMRTLLDGDLVESVSRHLAESGLAPSRLTLEITETNVMSDTSRTIEVLERLAGLGVSLSIDDFGTGYSSLSYLRRLPVHEIKIDKLFVQPMATDPDAEAIVCSILDLAKHMGLATVAEGVEDRPTWNRLRELGCEEAQGYFLARPMAGSDLFGWADGLGKLKLTEPSSSPRGTAMRRAPRRALIARDLSCVRIRRGA